MQREVQPMTKTTTPKKKRMSGRTAILVSDRRPEDREPQPTPAKQD